MIQQTVSRTLPYTWKRTFMHLTPNTFTYTRFHLAFTRECRHFMQLTFRNKKDGAIFLKQRQCENQHLSKVQHWGSFSRTTSNLSVRPGYNTLRTFMTSKKVFEVKPFNTTRNVRSDTLVFAHKNDSFYKMLSYFGIFQLGMWSYLSLSAFQQFKAVPVGLQDTSEMPWYKKLLYKQGQYKNALSLLSFIVGGVVFFITLSYPRRVIKSLLLLKGGDRVKITTYSWLGKTHTFTTPLDHLSCMESRSGKGHHIPMKIKNYNFYFIIDKQGSFPKTDLFDHVVGIKRKV